MRKKLIYITITTILIASIGITLAKNKSKIDAAAKPQTVNAVIPVKAVPVALDSFETSFTLNGSTAPYREVKVSSENPGKLTNVLVKNGDRLKAGQIIATLDPSVFTAQLLSVESSILKANLDITRFRKLLQLGGATQMQFEKQSCSFSRCLHRKKKYCSR